MKDAPRPIWLHGASVGDMRALAPLVAGLRASRPDVPLHISATTADGRRMARQLFPDLPVGRPPLTPGLAGRAMDAIRPRAVILEYLELWPGWVAAAHRRAVPVVVVDGRVTHRSLRIAPLLRRAAGRLALFCARSAGDADSARLLGVRSERIRVTGNGKHDGITGEAPAIEPALRAAVGDVQVVVGSLAPAEEEAALTALAATGLRALIAPRYIRRADRLIARARKLGVSVRRRSAGPAAATRWVVLDSVGELAMAYGLGRVAVVGGTFCRREGQTLVEPAVHGRPVVFGPRVANVAEEAEALRGRGGWPVPDWAVAFETVEGLLSDPGPDPRAVLRHLPGATRRNLDALSSILDPDGRDRDAPAGVWRSLDR